jgi:hypothetical protein
MTGAVCVRCHWDRAEVHITALAIDPDALVENGVMLLDPTCLSQPDAIQVEACCRNCGHTRYVEQEGWKWA